MYLATQCKMAGRESWQVVKWNQYRPLSVDHIEEVVDVFDGAVISSVELCLWMKLNLTPNCHQIPEEVHVLTLEKNRL